MKRERNVKCGIIITAFIFSLVLPAGVSSVQAEDLLDGQEMETEADSAEEEKSAFLTGYAAYDEILQEYISGFETGWESADFDENGLCYLAAYLSGADEMGYYLTDLDGDGTEELLVGEKGNRYEEDAYTGMFYELYTLDADTEEAERAAVSGERSRYYLCTDGTIGYEGSGGYNYSGSGHYQFNGSALEVLSFVLYDGDYDSENPYFYSTTDTWDDHSTPISESEAAAIRAAYEYMEIPWLALTESAAGAGDDISSIKTKAAEEVAAALEQAEEIANKLDTEPLSQSELNQYSYEMYQIWDDMLNTLWGYLKESLSEEEMAALTEEQLVWIADKENQAAAAGAEFEGGTMQPYLENTTAAALTKERVYVLLEMLP
ncbi:MAG: DUF1311 domain-containing protein [Clostridiales bacterium]|nr:DUF1311 domain-containing protein [Clostridiales bacterium]